MGEAGSGYGEFQTALRNGSFELALDLARSLPRITLFPWSPGLRTYWDRAFMDEKKFDELIEILVQRRKSPFKRFEK